MSTSFSIIVTKDFFLLQKKKRIRTDPSPSLTLTPTCISRPRVADGIRKAKSAPTASKLNAYFN